MTSPRKVRRTAPKIDVTDDRRPGAEADDKVQRPSNVGLALRLLELIAERAEAAGVAELGLAAGISRAKLQRSLNSLIEADLINHDAVEQTYQLAARSIHLAALIRNNAPLPRIAAPILEALAAETGETATLNAYRP
jgi:DNA-binding IclR family transcriptional regulator